MRIDTELSNYMSKLIDAVADDFISTMIAEGFLSFGDMKLCYGWDSEDLREEIAFVVNHKLYQLGAMLDDGRVQAADLEELSYRQFKNEVIRRIESREDELLEFNKN